MTGSANLTLDRVVHYPLPGLNSPTAARFSPEGRYVTYLLSGTGTLVRELWAFDLNSRVSEILVKAPGTGDTDESVTKEEALRRERLRMRGFGITSYAWADKEPVLLVPVLGGLYVSAGVTGELRALEPGGEALDPHLNASGTAVAFIQEGELHVLDLTRGAKPRRLTGGSSALNSMGERTRTNGLAEFIAQEEMGRSSGYWWSPDGSLIAFVQVDVSEIPPYPIVHQGADELSTEMHRYPFAGGPNASWRLGVVDVDTAVVRWLSVGEAADSYLARVEWTPDGKLLVQMQRRDQRRLDLIEFETRTHAHRPILSEEAETWINLHDDLRCIGREGGTPDDYQILWSSERSGFRHLYVYSKDGGESRALTNGDWSVDRVVGVHDRWVYFLAGKDSPLERQIYRVDLDGERLERLSQEPGMHSAILSPTGSLLLDLWDARHSAPQALLRATDGSIICPVFVNADSEPKDLSLTPPELLSVPAQDGTVLYGALYRPPPDAPAPPWPILVSVYGGPHVQLVSESWSMTADLRAQYLARQGYLVLKLDNRGSARRGHAFEAAILGDLGNLEVQDQVQGVRFVSRMPEADATRVGLYGWSYGGYMALMCLLRAPDTFQCGVAGAPVTDWGGYDTHYTERYMRTPAANPAGYESSSALHYAERLRGRLLLVHGMIDENVHFRHSARMAGHLIGAGKAFDLLPFPNERHMPRAEADRHYMERRLVQHFAASLRDSLADQARVQNG